MRQATKGEILADEREYTNRDAAEIIDNEGLDYAVRHYCDGKYFKDPITAALWDKAALNIQKLVDYLHDQGSDIQ